MSHHRSHVRALRRALADKSTNRWRWRHGKDRFRSALGVLKPLIGFLLSIAIVPAILSAYADSNLSPYSLTAFFALLVTLMGLIKLARWVQGTLFSARTRFFLALPGDPARNVLGRRMLAWVPTLVGSLLFFVYLTCHCFYLDGPSPPEIRVYSRPVLAGVISWLGNLGILGLAFPFLAWKRPNFGFLDNFRRGAIPIFVLLAISSNFDLSRIIALAMEYGSAVTRWIPSLWGIQDLDFDAPFRGHSILIAALVFALMGVGASVVTMRRLREMLTKKAAPLLAPHFAQAATSPLQPKRKLLRGLSSSKSRSISQQLPSRGFLERFLANWLTDEERLAARLNFGEGAPKLTRHWIVGTANLALAIAPIYYMKHHLGTGSGSVEALRFLLGFLPLGIFLAVAAMRLFFDPSSRRAFRPLRIGTTRAPAIAGFPVRWVDLARVEFKIAAIKHAAAIGPFLFFTMVFAEIMGWSVGLWMLIAFHVQLFALASMTLTLDRAKKNVMPVRFTTIWFWILPLIRWVIIFTYIAAGIATVILLATEELRPLAILPIALSAAVTLSAWWFIIRQSYNGVHLSLETVQRGDG